MDIYTRTGDDGTTGLLYGGRVRKDSAAPTAYGDVDEAQAAIGVARAGAERGGELDACWSAIERDLWVLMAELATAREQPQQADRWFDAGDRRDGGPPRTADRRVPVALRGTAGSSSCPARSLCPASLDLARTVTRRAERSAVAVDLEDSFVVKYLNRLSDLLFVLARWRRGRLGGSQGRRSLTDAVSAEHRFDRTTDERIPTMS